MPNKYTSRGRSVRLEVLLTPAEHEALIQRAAARGAASVADVVREALGFTEPPPLRAPSGKVSHRKRVEATLARINDIKPELLPPFVPWQDLSKK